LGEAVTEGVFAGAGARVDGVVGLVEVGGGVWAHTNPAKHNNAAGADSKRMPAFNEFPITCSERAEYTAIQVNGRLKVR
jgi:hypothetical protein